MEGGLAKESPDPSQGPLGSAEHSKGCPGGSVGKNPPANAQDAGPIAGTGGAPGEGKGNSLQYFCLENPTDREAWGLQSTGVRRQRQFSDSNNNEGVNHLDLRARVFRSKLIAY